MNVFLQELQKPPDNIRHACTMAVIDMNSNTPPASSIYYTEGLCSKTVTVKPSFKPSFFDMSHAVLSRRNSCQLRAPFFRW